MKLHYMGKIDNIYDLPKGILPKNAVKFKEPSTIFKLNLTAFLLFIPLLAITNLFVFIKSSFLGYELNIEISSLWGVLIALDFIVPRVLINAMCYPKEADVQIYYSIKAMAVFAFSTHPITKLRFIMMSLFPNIIFGLLPLFIWLTIPDNLLAQILFAFGSINLLFGSIDLINLFNAITQMPKGSYQQNSGFNSFWFMK